MLRGVRAVVALILAALLTACGTATPEPSSSGGWGGAAVEWLSRVEHAGREGIPNLEAFLAPDVVVDHRGTGGELARGREATLVLAWSMPYTHPGLRLHRPVYLSPTGMLVPASWKSRYLYGSLDAVMVMRLSRRGLVREEALASLVSGADAVDPHRDWIHVLETARRWLSAHRRPDERCELQVLPQGGGVAVYASPDADAPSGFRRIVLLSQATDPRGCPGHVAVSLTLRPDGEVRGVEQFQRIDDARRCRRGAGRFDGWWTRMTVPEPVQRVRTGTVTVGGVEVEIWNGTPVLESLVVWALGRFPHAGLPVPPTSSVTFYPAADRCQGNLAVADGPDQDAVKACFGEALACVSAPCPPWSDKSRSVILHEIAHTWLEEYADGDTRAEYERLVRLRWSDPDDPWERRAEERAAEVIAQSVQAEANPRRLLDIGPRALTAELAVLTEDVHPRTGR